MWLGVRVRAFVRVRVRACVVCVYVSACMWCGCVCVFGGVREWVCVCRVTMCSGAGVSQFWGYWTERGVQQDCVCVSVWVYVSVCVFVLVCVC